MSRTWREFRAAAPCNVDFTGATGEFFAKEAKSRTNGAVPMGSTMARYLLLMAALAMVGACDSSNPFQEDQPPEEDTGEDEGGEEDGEEDGEDGGGVDSSLDLPPGTTSPTPSSAIARYEARDGEDGDGVGYAENFRYNAATDTFSVDNLPFDGDNVYSRDDQVGTINTFAVYEGKDSVRDPDTGTPIDQSLYRLLYKVSNSGATEVAIVRTGSYVGHGFGGWTYERNDGNGVDLPVSLEATFSGEYAGLRTFSGAGGLEYTVGTIRMDIDWEDFNGGFVQDAIKGTVTDRRLFDMQGRDITQAYIDNLSAEAEAPQGAIPDLIFDVGPNTIDGNGEFTGSFYSAYTDGEGARVTLETGTYNGVFARDGQNGPTEAAGTMIMESDYPDVDDVTVRETGGFIVTR